MNYNKELTTNGNLDADKVLKKMNKLKAQFIAEGTEEGLAINFAFDYGRDLIGFDMAEAWRMGASS